MNVALLDILRCPFCGVRLRLLQSPFVVAEGDHVATGILCCQCCAYPVVFGIPYLCTGSAAETAMKLLGRGNAEQALFTLLGLDGARREAFARLLHEERALTFRSALKVLSPDAEGNYLLYRFSDPTYLCSREVLRAIGQDSHCFAARVLDLGGGAGHLTRTLCELGGASAEVILADVAFWKLWLAKRFVVPRCEAVCCNANEPLPFARGVFSLAFCSDAFHYVWSRRLLASELVRLASVDGVIVLTHLHNLLCENESAGMPLAPADYRNLFEGVDVRLFKESDVLSGILDGQAVDLSARHTDADLSEEPALILLAARSAGLFRIHACPHKCEQAVGRFCVNPLYRMEQEAGCKVLKLRFPSPEYEAEYVACKRYLPDGVPWDEGKQARLKAGVADDEFHELIHRCVLLDLPWEYC